MRRLWIFHESLQSGQRGGCEFREFFGNVVLIFNVRFLGSAFEIGHIAKPMSDGAAVDASLRGGRGNSLAFGEGDRNL